MRRIPMHWRTALTLALLVVLALGCLGSAIAGWFEQEMLLQVERELRGLTLVVEDASRCGTPDAQALAARLHADLGVRITLLAADRRIVADSEVDRAAPRAGTDERAADLAGAGPVQTLLERSTLSVTRRVERSASDVAYVRVARSIADIRVEIAQVHTLVWGMAGITAALALTLAYVLAGRVARPLREVAEAAQLIAHGHYGHKVYVDCADEVGTLARAFNHMSSQLAKQFIQLDEDRQQLRAVLSSMIEGVIAIDASQAILFANERAAAMLEFSARSAPGRKLWEVVRQRPLHELVRRVLSDAAGQSETLEYGEPSNKTLSVQVTQLPGEPVRGAVLVFSDTTELRRLERLRQDFVANVSHELKTPLSVIAANVETLLDGGVDDVNARGRFLERISAQAARLHLLILDLLSLARIESGAEHLVLEDLPLESAVRACLERHTERAVGKGQNLEAIPPHADSVVACADEEAVREILDNLVDNGLKYTPPGGAIRLRWWSEREWCCIEVSDTGIGIPTSELPRVFERFYRVDKARSRELGGTGLGLSIVKHLAQAMHGNVRVASEVNHGTTFTVSLPRSNGVECNR